MGTEEGVEGIIKEVVVDIIEVAIDLSGIEDTHGALDGVVHVPGVQNEDLCLLRDLEVDLAGLTDLPGLRGHLRLDHLPHIANHLSLQKDEGLLKSRPKKLKGLPKKIAL